MENANEIIASLSLELRRGVVVLSVLKRLHEPMYGYMLVRELERTGMAVEAGTLYPLLRRLERQKLLMSEWDTGGAKPRKYYSRTRLGTAVYDGLMEQWDNIVRSMADFHEEGGRKND